jgi:Holliday junction resolvase
VVTNPQKNKGDKAERELAALLADQLGIPVRRKLGAGRLDDCGDIDGLPDTTIECKSFRDVMRGIREGVDDCVREQANAGTTFGVTFVRRPGGRWIAVQTIDQFCTMWREAT